MPIRCSIIPHHDYTTNDAEVWRCWPSLVRRRFARTERTSTVTTQMKRFDVSGISFSVLKDGTTIKMASYGFADVARKIPDADDKIYKIGSISKQFIASGAMLLVQDGRLKLDEPVSTYLTGTPPAWQAIAVRHLLTHTAGLERESPGFAPMKAQTDAEVIQAAYAVPLAFPPGTKWAYSNLG